MKYVFDTSILIDHLRNITDARILVEKVERKEVEGIISVITEAELLSAKRCEDAKEREMIEKLLKIFRKVELDNEIAKIAAKFRREYGISLLDAIIAAVGFKEKCAILTKNIKDFERVKVVEIKKPY
ncbi:MAG: PIN domain-containing protein [Thermoproteota archaeon]|jgi:predicted nucleic acid-binding protein|nr:PIN domain-containing protein [Thermoproteota archaeon]